MKNIHHTPNTSPFDYDEYKADDRSFIDWIAIVAVFLFGCMLAGIISALLDSI